MPQFIQSVLHVWAFRSVPILQIQTMPQWITLSMCIFPSLKECLQGKFLEVGLLGGGINAWLVWLDIAKFPATGLVPFCISTNYEQECLLSHSLTIWVQCQAFGCLWIFHWKMVSQCNFNLHVSHYKHWTSFHRFEVHCASCSELVFHNFCLFSGGFLIIFKNLLIY